MRALSEEFVHDLKNPDGLLHPILKRVKQDDTLMLAIRNNYINIYYRGGNILKVEKGVKGSYATSFDSEYNKEGRALSLPKSISCKGDARAWIDEFPHLKQIMDIFFANKGKLEREFQQLVARENNNSTISNESEYFISDIEFNDASIGARFDMLAIRWRAADRKDGSKCRAAFIEMKYGDSALGSNAGMLKHLKDFDKLISDRDKYKSLLETMESQFNQLHELELLHFNQSPGTKVKLVAKDKPEVIFMLANHNPRGKKLIKKILSDPKFIELAETNLFDLRFFVSCFAGYGLHTNCMFSLADFTDLLKRLNTK